MKKGLQAWNHRNIGSKELPNAICCNLPFEAGSMPTPTLVSHSFVLESFKNL